MPCKLHGVRAVCTMRRAFRFERSARKQHAPRELGAASLAGMIFALLGALRFIRRSRFCATPERAMNLILWLPGLFLLGMIGMGVMFAFVAGCDRV